MEGSCIIEQYLVIREMALLTCVEKNIKKESGINCGDILTLGGAVFWPLKVGKYPGIEGRTASWPLMVWQYPSHRGWGCILA